MWEDMAYYIPTVWKNEGTHPLCATHNCVQYHDICQPNNCPKDNFQLPAMQLRQLPIV